MSQSATVLVSTFAPFSTLCLYVPSGTPFDDLYDVLAEKYPELPNPHDLLLRPTSNFAPSATTLLSEFPQDGRSHEISLQLFPRLLGGKGGFGSQLRAAGGRMSSQKTSNNDSCRDLTGRRLSTIKEAKKLAEYIDSEPARKKAEADAKKAKLEALEKKLGISKDGESSQSKKRRLDNDEYIEQSREIVENVKSAVSAALLKKRKKTKISRENPSQPQASPVEG
ncbi:hypothetical protein BDM02DRAFT_3095597 [Thelephora ganbajun]|uniref:Uncharacterized protein n=1 Tax=Thelephora ganbajun TaxID=370292 RepID=A0ACB6ZHE4_THEGA|nr:hypothetical protein BDM02DRAFT_3095597 [Thelephora ganbajun]